MPGSLYLVATPIGNLEDISYRAVRILGEVAAIACEDTRQTRKLLAHYNIHTPLLSCHEHNEAARANELVARLAAGESIALVSDAGTPLVSDPGYRLVAAAIAAAIPVVPIPGPSAVLAALAASGLPTDSFQFGGFLPAKTAQRRRELTRLADVSGTLIFYEAPHRLAESLADIAECLGPERLVAVARELTKLHEEFVRGTAAEVRDQFAARESVRGEVTILIGKAPPSTTIADDASLRAEVAALVQAGQSPMDAIKQIARQHRLGKREVYRIWEGHS